MCRRLASAVKRGQSYFHLLQKQTKREELEEQLRTEPRPPSFSSDSESDSEGWGISSGSSRGVSLWLTLAAWWRPKQSQRVNELHSSGGQTRTSKWMLMLLCIWWNFICNFKRWWHGCFHKWSIRLILLPFTLYGTYCMSVLEEWCHISCSSLCT